MVPRTPSGTLLYQSEMRQPQPFGENQPSRFDLAVQSQVWELRVLRGLWCLFRFAGLQDVGGFPKLFPVDQIVEASYSIIQVPAEPWAFG